MKISSGEILYLLRKGARYSTTYISDYLSVSRPTYERYEKNVVEIPLSKLCSLARLYEIETMELLEMVVQTQHTIKISYKGNSDDQHDHNDLENTYPLAKC